MDFTKWGDPTSTHVDESTRKAVGEWERRAQPLAMATIKAAFLVEPVVDTCPLHSRGHRMAGSYPHLRKQMANSPSQACEFSQAFAWEGAWTREPLVNKLSAAWVGSRLCCGLRLSGTRKLERSGTGQCQASQSSQTLGARLSDSSDTPWGSWPWHIRHSTHWKGCITMAYKRHASFTLPCLQPCKAKKHLGEMKVE